MSSAYTKPSDLVRAVYFEHVNHFGEPDHSIRFGDGTVRDGEEHFPPLMDVMIWRADESVDITTFSTIGMSERPMDGCDFRAYIYTAPRKPLPMQRYGSCLVMVLSIPPRFAD